jgi:hypothetical protein
MIEKAEVFFAGLSEIGSGLPQFILVPLIMILAAVGTAAIVGLLLGLVRLIFGKKAIDFIKNIPQRLNNAANGFNGSQNEQ